MNILKISDLELNTHIELTKARIAELDEILDAVGTYSKKEENKMLNEIWRLQTELSALKDERIKRNREAYKSVSTKALNGGAIYCDNKSISDYRKSNSFIIRGVSL